MSGSSGSEDSDTPDGDVSDVIMSDSSSDEDFDDEDIAGSSGEQDEEGEGGEDNEEAEEEEEEEEDEVVKAIQAEKDKPKVHPPNITFEDIIVKISFHPKEDLIAAASVTGDVFLYNYGLESNELKSTWELHTKACRDVEFSDDGLTFYSCGKEKCVMLTDTNTGKLKKFYENAHENPLYCLYIFDEHVFCTGDEDGIVKVWDDRQETSVASFKKMEDFVSDMVSNDDKKYLVCSCGDGSLNSFDMNTRTSFLRSEEYDVEFTCLDVFKQDTKLVVGTGKGKMYIFNWEQFGYHSDELPGVKKSISAMVPVTENIVVAGYDDGFLRATNLFPHRQLGVVGQHEFSIEDLDISNDGTYIASCSLDHTVKFWNIRFFEDIHVENNKVKNKKKDLSNNLPSSKAINSADFFSGLA